MTYNDFGDLGPDLASRVPEPSIRHDFPDLEEALRSLIHEPTAEVSSYRLSNWASRSIKDVVKRVVRPRDVAVAVGPHDGGTLLKVMGGDASALAEVSMGRRVWGERIAFAPVVDSPVNAWRGERPGFSVVVIADAGPYVLLLESSAEVIERIVADRLLSLRTLAENTGAGT